MARMNTGDASSASEGPGTSPIAPMTATDERVHVSEGADVRIQVVPVKAKVDSSTSTACLAVVPTIATSGKTKGRRLKRKASVIDSVKPEGNAPQERAPPTKKPRKPRVPRAKPTARPVDPAVPKKRRGRPPKTRTEAPGARPPSPPLPTFRPPSLPAYPDDAPIARAPSFDGPKHPPLARGGSISSVGALSGLAWDPAGFANMHLSALPWLAGAAYAPVPIHFAERDVLFGEHYPLLWDVTEDAELTIARGTDPFSSADDPGRATTFPTAYVPIPVGVACFGRY
ncbi:uncharacterized protein BXZ73DRAFT_99194 [Epithele typhae]|uniref:uncharacterized protein n=1 Tax=Epithele typhae TaxID=378194 RepID=UPI002007BCD4|nr:uncharacterized protein BXZ73DRAFT_99194 [Epithele typhae]KAH9940198.1 hypothetical protein BXZ73DRAFT_99194 [Epithele typhae]